MTLLRTLAVLSLAHAQTGQKVYLNLAKGLRIVGAEFLSHAPERILFLANLVVLLPVVLIHFIQPCLALRSFGLDEFFLVSLDDGVDQGGQFARWHWKK